MTFSSGLLIGLGLGLIIGSVWEFYRQRKPDYLPTPIAHIQGSERRMATERKMVTKLRAVK